MDFVSGLYQVFTLYSAHSGLFEMKRIKRISRLLILVEYYFEVKAELFFSVGNILYSSVNRAVLKKILQFIRSRIRIRNIQYCRF